MSAFTYKEQHDITLPEEGGIIKPPDATGGFGTAYVAREKLPAAIAYLTDRTKPNPFADEPRFSGYWTKTGNPSCGYAGGPESPFMVQHMISGLNSQGVEATFRIIFAAKTNDNGELIGFETIDIVEKNAIPLKEKCSRSVISLTPFAARQDHYTTPYMRVVDENENIYQLIQATTHENMKQFMPNLRKTNLSRIWIDRAEKVSQHNDYISWLMPKIERNNWIMHHDSVLQKIKEIIIGNNVHHRTQLNVLFTYNYFGRREYPLPNFARNPGLFFVIIYYILTERYPANLSNLLQSAQNALLSDAALRQNPTGLIQDFLLDDITKSQISYIVDHVTWRLQHPREAIVFSTAGHRISPSNINADVQQPAVSTVNRSTNTNMNANN